MTHEARGRISGPRHGRQWREYVNRMATAALLAGFVNASVAQGQNYACAGPVTYLGLGQGGEVTLSVASGPIHYVCSLGTQGAYTINVASCKGSYAAILAAQLSGREIRIFYSPNGLTCGTLPSWAAVPTAYFIQAPI
jgi:hypothetical protein